MFGNVHEKKRQCASRQYSSERSPLSLFVGEPGIDLLVRPHLDVDRLDDAQGIAVPVQYYGLQPGLG